MKRRENCVILQEQHGIVNRAGHRPDPEWAVIFCASAPMAALDPLKSLPQKTVTRREIVIVGTALLRVDAVMLRHTRGGRVGQRSAADPATVSADISRERMFSRACAMTASRIPSNATVGE